MESEQDISASNKHQKTKQKWKTSADAVRKNDKTKTRSVTSIILMGNFNHCLERQVNLNYHYQRSMKIYQLTEKLKKLINNKAKRNLSK